MNDAARILTVDRIPSFIETEVAKADLRETKPIKPESLNGLLESKLPKDQAVITAQYAYEWQDGSWIGQDERWKRRPEDSRGQQGGYVLASGVNYDIATNELRFKQEAVYNQVTGNYEVGNGARDRSFVLTPGESGLRYREYAFGDKSAMELTWNSVGPKGNTREMVRVFVFDKKQ